MCTVWTSEVSPHRETFDVQYWCRIEDVRRIQYIAPWRTALMQKDAVATQTK